METTNAKPNYSTLSVFVEQHIAQINLNRPDYSNAINLKMWDEFKQNIDLLDQNDDVRVIIINGNGKHFCAGIDLAEIAGLIPAGEHCEGKKRDQLRLKLLKLQESFTALTECRKPVIAAIQGACVGAGLDLISACDIRLCDESAVFSLKEIDLSIVADMGVLQRLPHILSDGILRELAYTARKVGALEAQQINLVNKVLPNLDELRKEALKLANNIAAKSPIATRGIKQIINYSREHSIKDGLDYVATWNAGMLLSDDLTEALSAYQQKRVAVF